LSSPNFFLNSLQKLPSDFYGSPATAVAQSLLGKIFVHSTKSTIYSGIIVETEAYDQTDAASHSYSGLSKRNEAMFKQGGHLYVYLIYGMYNCMNVVTGNEGSGEAVLIRAVEPVTGIREMIKNRFGRKESDMVRPADLTSGPGKLCKAFSIGLKHNGHSLLSDDIFFAESSLFSHKFRIIKTTRIGITKDSHLKRRFHIDNNSFVSG